MTRRRLQDIEGIHASYRDSDLGAVTAFDAMLDAQSVLQFRDRRPVPVVSGRFDTGDAQKRLLDVLSNLGIIQDDTEQGDLPDTDGYGAIPTVTAAAGIGNTGTVTIEGTDTSGEITIVPGGSGIAVGSQFTFTFANPRASAKYNWHLSFNSNASRSLATPLGPTSRATTGFTVDSRTALTSGSTYLYGYHITEFEY
jgi:hypothetical protein